MDVDTGEGNRVEYMIKINEQYQEQFPAGTRIRVTETYSVNGTEDTTHFVGLEGTVLDYANFDVYIGVELENVPTEVQGIYESYLLVLPEELEKI